VRRGGDVAAAAAVIAFAASAPVTATAGTLQQQPGHEWLNPVGYTATLGEANDVVLSVGGASSGGVSTVTVVDRGAIVQSQPPARVRTVGAIPISLDVIGRTPTTT
jgi:hypothetical protein